MPSNLREEHISRRPGDPERHRTLGDRCLRRCRLRQCLAKAFGRVTAGVPQTLPNRGGADDSRNHYADTSVPPPYLHRVGSLRPAVIIPAAQTDCPVHIAAPRARPCNLRASGAGTAKPWKHEIHGARFTTQTQLKNPVRPYDGLRAGARADLSQSFPLCAHCPQGVSTAPKLTAGPRPLSPSNDRRQILGICARSGAC